MNEIVVQIQDDNKVSILTDLLQSLNFVVAVRVEQKHNRKRLLAQQKTTADFFAYAGLWADRDVTGITLRNKAWPRQAQ